MTTPSTVNQVYAFLKSLETAALNSANAEVKAFGQAMTDAVGKFEAAVPGLATEAVNAGIAALTAKEPIFSILVPLESVIDPLVSGVAQTFETMLIKGAVAVPVAAAAVPQTPAGQ